MVAVCAGEGAALTGAVTGFVAGEAWAFFCWDAIKSVIVRGAATAGLGAAIAGCTTVGGVRAAMVLTGAVAGFFGTTAAAGGSVACSRSLLGFGG
ncbi:MAG TPA: hypothetical protein VGF62_09690, partial [Rhizomicrobium sp.]